jgi:hypothetical protein
LVLFLFAAFRIANVNMKITLVYSAYRFILVGIVAYDQCFCDCFFSNSPTAIGKFFLGSNRKKPLSADRKFIETAKQSRTIGHTDSTTNSAIP